MRVSSFREAIHRADAGLPVAEVGWATGISPSAHVDRQRTHGDPLPDELRRLTALKEANMEATRRIP